MKEVLLKKLLLASSYFVIAFLVETITFLIMGFGGAAEYVLLDIACMLIFTAVIYVIPSFTAQAVVIVMLLVLQCLLSVVNQCLYDMSGYVFVFSMLVITDDAVGAFSLDFLNFYLIAVFLVMLIAEGFYLYTVCKRVKVKQARRGQNTVLVLFLAFVLAGAAEGMYFAGKASFVRAEESDPAFIYKDDGYLYDSQFITAKAFKTFGTFSFYYKNLTNYLSGLGNGELSEESIEERVSALDAYFSEGQTSDSLEQLDLTPYGGNGQILTGMLDGQNIAMIVIESGEWFGINATYTPTLYALANQGVSMVNYLARDKTNHSEALSIFGSYPVEDRNTFDMLLDNTFPFTLPNVLQGAGYTTNYYHAGDSVFYNRDQTFGSGLYGFAHAGFSDTLNKMKGYYEKKNFYDFDRDSELISQYLDDFTKIDAEDSAFYTQMMTLISHGTYADLIDLGDYSADWTEEQKQQFSEACTVKGLEAYYECVDDYPAADSYVSDEFAITAQKTDETGAVQDTYLLYKRYQAGLMDLDVGVNRLLHDLQENGELGNTAFFFYADHNAYYSDLQYKLKNVPLNEVWNLTLYNIPFFFWSGKYMPLTVESDLYDGLVYEKTDISSEVLKENGLGEQDFYSGAFYYDIGHTAPNSRYSFLSGARIEKFCNSFDILPTVLDLLGYTYNTELYQGVSLFDAPTSLFVSRESGMFSDSIYMAEEQLYIRAEANENGSMRSLDGEILFYTDGDGVARVTVWNDYGEATYLAEEVSEYMYLEDGYIVYESGAIFGDSENDRRELFSRSAFSFLERLSEYYDRQAQLEEMFFIDYFRYADVDEFVSLRIG